MSKTALKVRLRFLEVVIFGLVVVVDVGIYWPKIITVLKRWVQ